MANPHNEVQLPDGYLSDDAMIVLTRAPATSTENPTFSGDENNDMSQLGKDVLPIRKIQDSAENYYRFDWKVGKSGHRKLLKKGHHTTLQINDTTRKLYDEVDIRRSFFRLYGWKMLGCISSQSAKKS